MAKVYAHTPYVAYILPVGSEIAVGWEAVNRSWEEVLHNVTSKIDMSYNRAGAPKLTEFSVGGRHREGAIIRDGKTVDFAVLRPHLSTARLSLAHDFSPAGQYRHVVEHIPRDARVALAGNNSKRSLGSCAP